jgi:hypothetical protein
VRDREVASLRQIGKNDLAAVERLEKELEDHRKHVPDKSAKNLVIQNYKEKEAYLCYEVRIIICSRAFVALMYVCNGFTFIFLGKTVQDVRLLVTIQTAANGGFYGSSTAD